MTTVTLDGGPLKPEQVLAVAWDRAEVIVDHRVWQRMAPAREIVEAAVSEDRVVYGITTGFGALASTRVEPSEAEALQVNLLRSHAAGVGDPLDDAVVRAMLLLRARTLAQGHSGVRPVIVERLVQKRDGVLRAVFDILIKCPNRGHVSDKGRKL